MESFPKEPVQWMPNSKNPWSPYENAIVIISTILHSLDIILGWSPIMTSRPLTSNCKERLPRCQIVLFRHYCTLLRHISYNLLFGGVFLTAICRTSQYENMRPLGFFGVFSLFITCNRITFSWMTKLARQ